jgi:hypothetical protein
MFITPIEMKTIALVILSLLLTGCYTSYKSAYPYVPVFPKTAQFKQFDSGELRVHFVDTVFGYHEFQIEVRNTSKDVILFESTGVSYTILPNSNMQTPVFGIQPEDRTDQLKLDIDSLSKMKNPYALANKSTGEIVQEGLVTGTIAAIFGHKPDDYEELEKDRELNWEKKNRNKLRMHIKELSYWENQQEFHCEIQPGSKCNVKLVFKIAKDVDGIELHIPIQDEVLGFLFTKKN